MEIKNKILIVCTSATSFSRISSKEEDTHARTGTDVKELAYLYHCLTKRSGYQIVLASTQDSSPIPFDPRSIEDSKDDEIVQEFLKDREAMDCVKSPCDISEIVDKARDFSAIIIPGGAGCMIDLTDDSIAKELSKLVNRVYDDNEGIVAAIGFGLAALVNVQKESETKDKEPTSTKKENAWLKNRAVTCNTTEEIKDMQLDKKLPFNLEQKLKDLGVKYHKTDKFRPYVVIDERLITAQNRNSSKEWVNAIVKELNKND